MTTKIVPVREDYNLALGGSNEEKTGNMFRDKIT